MTNRIEKWVTPAFGLVLAAVMALVELRRSGSALQAVAIFAIVGGYAAVVFVLRTRSETFGLLAGVPVDERWRSINQRALATTAQLMALVLVASFLGVEATGGDGMPYAWTACVLALGYLGSILWFRWRT
jgi:hypothetical protein